MLKVSRAFYLKYSYIKEYLQGKCATPSHQLEISPTASGKSLQKSPTPSDKFVTPAEKQIMNLSFSHIVDNAKTSTCLFSKNKVSSTLNFELATLSNSC